MIMSCPECELPVSDQAISCPHCGFPIKSTERKKGKTKAHMRLPNGFGRITEIKSGNLRNRFRVTVTVCKDENGKPIGKLLKPQAYFRTYNDAYQALVEYNKNPYDLSDRGLTVKDLYERWHDYYAKTLKAKSSDRTVTSAWKKCQPLYNMRAADVRPGHIKDMIVNADASDGTKSRMKSVFNLMYDYAVEHELVDKNPARTFKIQDSVVTDLDKPEVPHISFTDEEMDKLWANVDMLYVNIILVQCYMGWRPQELGLLKLKNVDLNGGKIIGGMKTDAGEDRLVPIHPKVLPFVQALYDEAVGLGSEYLINCTDARTHSSSGYKMTYDKYEYRFKRIMKELGLNPDHRPHDPRKQFTTMCKKYKVDEYAIKHMIGHKILDLTESVYTDRDENWLFEELNKIPS